MRLLDFLIFIIFIFHWSIINNKMKEILLPPSNSIIYYSRYIRSTKHKICIESVMFGLNRFELKKMGRGRRGDYLPISNSAKPEGIYTFILIFSSILFVYEF